MNVTMSGGYVKGWAETCGQLGRTTPPATLPAPAGPPFRPPPTGSSSFAVAPYGSVHLESEADPAARADD
ncbi:MULTISPECIES: hypothetical protein [unclassified Streptomyces]|uniref:hypothetical protein n=1 Tax=unclassified Streptomyces TaxID=2593676 RepID=UPI003255D722|nr:hypothetical protein OG832_21270 [Streptomyces sp. NBC_00826]